MADDEGLILFLSRIRNKTLMSSNRQNGSSISGNALLRHNIKQNKRLKPGRLRWAREASLMPSDRALQGRYRSRGPEPMARAEEASRSKSVKSSARVNIDSFAVCRPRPLLFWLIPIKRYSSIIRIA